METGEDEQALDEAIMDYLERRGGEDLAMNLSGWLLTLAIHEIGPRRMTSEVGDVVVSTSATPEDVLRN